MVNFLGKLYPEWLNGSGPVQKKVIHEILKIFCFIPHFTVVNSRKPAILLADRSSCKLGAGIHQNQK